MFDLFDRYGGGVIYVTHNRDEINRFCDWVAVMEQGSVVELLSKRDLFERPVHLSTAKLSGCKTFQRQQLYRNPVQLMKNIPPVVALKP